MTVCAFPCFSWNIVTDLRYMWQFGFLQNEVESGIMIAIIAGIIGYFVVLRRSSFATHALGHTGFSGAAGAVLIGINPVWGLLAFTSCSGAGIALLGRRAANRDVEIGTVLAFCLGIGLLFLSFYRGYATEAYSLLFGEIEGVSPEQVVATFWAGLGVLAVLMVFYRPLLLSSLDEDVAEARGLPMLTLNLVFMLLLAVTITLAVQVIGVLLIFALMVTPAAAAVRLTRRPLTAVIVSVSIAITCTLLGIIFSFYLDQGLLPVSFLICTFAFAIYVIVRGVQGLLMWLNRRGSSLDEPAPSSAPASG